MIQNLNKPDLVVSEHLPIMTLKDDAKFKGKLICHLKKHLKNLVNFHASRRMPENLHFDQMFLSKTYKDLDEKVQKSWSHDTEE